MSRSKTPELKEVRPRRLTSDPPVVTLGPPRLPGVFRYTDNEWAKVARTNRSWSPGIADSSQLLADLEAAGQRYQASRRDPHLQKKLELALSRARKHVDLARSARFPQARIDTLMAAVEAIETEIGGGRTAVIQVAFQAWLRATRETKLKRSTTLDGKPDGPLIRYLRAALSPILGKDMVSDETLIKAIRSARR